MCSQLRCPELRFCECGKNHVWRRDLDQTRFVMSTVEEIKSAISVLSEEDYIRLREWFSGKDWEQWDKEIERDSASGKLDFLTE